MQPGTATATNANPIVMRTCRTPSMVGYQVLLDKDNRTSRWKPPSLMAHVPGRPTEAEYLSLIGEFWWEATYVARSLRREDPIFAKFCLDYQIKLEVMRRMLEWRMEIEHDWRIRPGVHGRNLNRLLPADIWDQWSRPMSVRKWKRIGSRCFPP